MHFKKIEIHGFKSFAEPVTIEFDRGITCVVGPNGSGKSNISDAIRWVLGEQSPKMLRGAKMDEVIFSGTAGRKSRGMAEVTLTIDNSDRSLDIDFQEVALTRRMYRTGESEYFINKSQCRLRDIRELIMDTGIGVDGYSIIGQGRIADILSNKTESRREIFEEAAGIVAYRTRKAESERKLDSTRANMDRVLDIISEIDRKLPSLEEDSAKAAEYLKLRDRYRDLEINIILRNIEKLQLAAEYIKDDLMELDIELEGAREERKEAEDVLADCNRKNENLEQISVETHEKLLNAIDELNNLVSRSELDKERVAYIDRTTETLKSEIAQSVDKLSREKENRNQLEISKREADKEAIALRSDLDSKVTAYREMSDEMASLMADADQLRNNVYEATSRISAAKAEISSLRLLRDNLESREQQIISRKESGDDTGKDTIDRLNRLRTERSHAEDSLDELKERQAEVLKDVILSKAERTSLREEQAGLRIKLGEIATRAKTLREMEDNYDGYNFAVKHVMKSNLSGLHGVVADLIRVPEEYTTAIETALGGSIQNVVCDDDKSARDAISSLKKNKAGRLTFLPISSVRGNFKKDGRAESNAGFLGFAPELVEYEEKYDSIIANLLGKVIVVDNIDNAISMSKKVNGYRFVTLDGEVISGTGAITGGRYKHKTANILDRKAEISNLESQLEETRTRMSEVEAKLAKVNSDIDAKERISEDLDASIRQNTYELMEKDNTIKMAETSLRDLKSDAERLDEELKNIEAEREKSEAMESELSERIKADEMIKTESGEKAEEKLDEYGKLKESFDLISEDITAARIKVNTCEGNLNHIEDMLKKSDETVSEAQYDMETKENRLKSLAEEKNGITSGHEDIADLISDREKARNRLQEYMSEINEEKAVLTKKITESTEAKDLADGRIAQVQEKKYQLDIKQTKNETQLENFKEKLWEDFEVSYAQALDHRREDFAMSSAVKENRQIKARMKELGEVNIGAIEEYREEKKRYDFLTDQRDDIQEAMDAICGIIDDLDKTIRTRFKTSFDQIVINFEAKFHELFGGGHAELRLSNENDPLESDIDIIAQPPGKKLQNINLLSGGEKTLTAIALMFAVLEAKPTPFCILDEVESALDDANIDRFIDCLRTLHGIQFTLVTHQKATMEHADVLYGVTMPEKGVSKVLSLNMAESVAGL